MFEHSLLQSQNGARSKARVLFVPLAFGVHGLILAGVAVGQYWNVDPIAEPPIAVAFLSSLPPPPPPAAPPPPPPGARVERQERVELSDEPVQPIRIPDEISQAPVVELSSVAGDGTGLPGGVPFGVPNGLPGGSRDGVPNGVPHGVPGGVDVENRIHQVVGDVIEPEALERVQPLYTESARRVRVQGIVIVETIVGVDGRVTPLRVLKSLPMGLTESAVDAVRAWRFKPAMLDGRPVSVYFTLTVKFELQ